MPNVQQSDKWFVRIDAPREFLAEKCLMMSLQAHLMLSVFHHGEKGDNPHCHMIVHMTSILQKQSLDVKLKKLFGVSGNGYSSKIWDGNYTDEGAGTYLFHEDVCDSNILCKKGITEEQITKLRSMAILINRVIAANRSKAETKIPGKVLQKWEEKGKPELSDKDIVFMICEMARDGECYLPKSDFQWKAYVEEVKLKMCSTPEEFLDFQRSTYLRIYRV